MHEVLKVLIYITLWTEPWNLASFPWETRQSLFNFCSDSYLTEIKGSSSGHSSFYNEPAFKVQNSTERKFGKLLGLKI